MANDNATDYEKYIERIEERKMTITARIANISDPIEAIDVIVQNEGINLKAVWETDSGYPVDAVMFCIVILPLILGFIGSFVASFWKPRMYGKELYDEYGRRIVEYPSMPIAYLQQSAKDVMTVRDNRNSLSWLCHRWLISTNDVVKELQSPYPLEQQKRISNWGILNPLARYYMKLITPKKPKYNKQKKKKGKGKKSAFKVLQKSWAIPPRPKDFTFVNHSIWRARRLWKKLTEWRNSLEDSGIRFSMLVGEKRSDKDEDSYWSSSETFSSDSGEHWKSYRSNVSNWVDAKKLNARWAQQRRINMLEKEINQETAPRKSLGALAAYRKRGTFDQSQKRKSTNFDELMARALRARSPSFKGKTTPSLTSMGRAMSVNKKMSQTKVKSGDAAKKSI